MPLPRPRRKRVASSIVGMSLLYFVCRFCLLGSLVCSFAFVDPFRVDVDGVMDVRDVDFVVGIAHVTPYSSDPPLSIPIENQTVSDNDNSFPRNRPQQQKQRMFQRKGMGVAEDFHSFPPRTPSFCSTSTPDFETHSHLCLNRAFVVTERTVEGRWNLLYDL